MVFYSHDVLFNKSSSGFEESNEQESKRCVELDYFSDEEFTNDVAEPVLPRSVNAESLLRWSKRVRQPPVYYGEWAITCISNGNAKEPTSVKEALVSPDKVKWTIAMEKEMESLHSNDAWDLVELPKDQKAVGSNFVFKLKIGATDQWNDTRRNFLLKDFCRNSVLIAMKHFLL